MRPVRHYWVPASGGRGWDLVEARKAPERGWELRRPGKFGARTVPEVPIPGEDWVLAEPPARQPTAPVTPEEEAGTASKPKPGPARKSKPVRIAVKGDAAREVPPRVVPERPPRRPGARHTKPVPKLSRELMDLMAQAQLDQAAPPGKTKCPRCGVILEPMKVRKVRTHDDPLKGARCEASGQRLET